jgi:hypothetical protein
MSASTAEGCQERACDALAARVGRARLVAGVTRGGSGVATEALKASDATGLGVGSDDGREAIVVGMSAAATTRPASASRRRTTATVAESDDQVKDSRRRVKKRRNASS